MILKVKNKEDTYTEYSYPPNDVTIYYKLINSIESNLKYDLNIFCCKYRFCRNCYFNKYCTESNFMQFNLNMILHNLDIRKVFNI